MAKKVTAKTDQDFARGDVEATPRMRLSLLAPLSLTTSWQDIPFGGTSALGLNVNTFPLESDGEPRMRWLGDKIDFSRIALERSFLIETSFVFQTAIITGARVQMRFMIPNTNITFPNPDSLGYRDLADLERNDIRTYDDTQPVYNNASLQANGLKIQLRLKGAAIQSPKLTDCAINIFAR